MTAYVCFDIETSTRTEYKRKANPFSADNYVVASGACRGRLSDPFSPELGARTVGDYFPAFIPGGLYACKALPTDWFTQHLKDTKLLVGVNIKFDLLYALANPNSNPTENLSAWMDYINGGGTIWDCQLAEYLLEGMAPSSHMLSMDEMAPGYGGDTKVDEVKALWNAGVDTIDIPEDMLMRYLLGGGDVKGDIRNTELIFRGQWERAKASGQLRSILLNMGALLFTVEAERNGMYVDKALGEELAVKMAETLASLHTELAEYTTGLPFEFNWNSRFHKSALIFGGRVKYEAKADVLDDEGNLTYYLKDERHVALANGGTLNESVWELLQATPDGTDTEALRFAGGKNKGELKTKMVKVPDTQRGPKQRMEDFWHAFPGFTKADPKWASDSDPGVYSTAAEVIEALGNRDIPFLKKLAQVVALTKDLGTYFWAEDDKGQRKGMLTLVQLDSIIHHMLNMCSTVTGRLSSSNPNLQNLPKGKKSDVKKLFKSRWGAEGTIIQSDFSSLEVYVQAILTKAVNLIADLKAGKDMHCVRLAAKTGVDYDEVVARAKDKAHPLYAEWDYMRTGAKEFSFQRAYGAGAAAISDSTGMALADVEALIEAEEARNPEIAEFIGSITQDLMRFRKTWQRDVPHPDIPGLKVDLHKSSYATPDGKVYSFRETPAPEYMVRKGRKANFMPTEVKNYPFQGTGGEWMKAAMWLVLRAMYHYRNFEGKALIVNTVHDAAYLDAHNSVRAKTAALLHVCMEEASTFMAWFFKWDIPLGVPSDTSWGPSMADEHRIEDPVYDKARAALTPWIRSRFIGGHQPSFI